MIEGNDVIFLYLLAHNCITHGHCPKWPHVQLPTSLASHFLGSLLMVSIRIGLGDITRPLKLWFARDVVEVHVWTIVYLHIMFVTKVTSSIS